MAAIVPCRPETLLPPVALWRASFEHGVVDPAPLAVWRQYLVEHVAVHGFVPTRQPADVTYRWERAGNI